MKCLVTGGLGYIGSHFVLEAIRLGLEPVIVDNLSNSSIKVLDRLEQISQTKIKFFQIDLLDNAGLETIFSVYNFDAVVHFAGLKAVSDSNSEPLNYYQNNVVGSVNLIGLMAKYQVNKIIFSSSATVYGDAVDMPCTESNKKQPVSPYGKTKSMVEDILEDYCASNNKMSAISLRYFNPIGAHPSGLLGDSPVGKPNNLLPYITRVAKKCYNELNVYGCDYETVDGSGVRDYIHVMDLIAGHLAALNHQKTHQGYETFNLGCGKGTSVIEMVQTFERINHVKVPLKMQARRAGDLAEYWACSNKAKLILNWQTKHGIEDMVRDAWHFEQSNPMSNIDQTRVLG